MTTCPYCQHSTFEKDNFCSNCGKQVKCKGCGKSFQNQVNFCPDCGESIIAQKSSQSSMNKYSLKEKRTASVAIREIELTLSDNAIEKAVPLFNSQLPLSTLSSEEKFVYPETSHLQILPENKEQENITPNQVVEIAPTIPTEQVNNNKSNYFSKNNEGILISKIKDYKGKNKKLQQQRFILLYVSEYIQSIDKSGVEKNHIFQAARKNNLYDKNFAHYFSDAEKRWLLNLSDKYQLNDDGETEISTIIEEMKDNQIKGFEYWTTQKPKPRAKKTKLNEFNIEEIDKWIKMDSKCSSFDINQITLNYQWCMFALYDITKSIQVTPHVKPNIAYEYLKKRYKVVSISEEQFISAIRSKTHKGKFKHTSENEFYLHPKAESEVDKWINVGKISD